MKSPETIKHQSSKEDKDYLLEYNTMDLSKVNKVNLFGVQFTNATVEEAVAQISRWIDSKQSYKHVLFLDPIKLMKMRAGKKLHRIADKASMVLADGAGLVWASNHQLKSRVPMISVIMALVKLSELKNYTIFMLGSKEENIERVYFNLTKHFPKLRIIGRHAGHLNKQRELMVKEAIRKTSPDIILIGNDFPNQEIWIENNTAFFGKAVVIGVNGAFDILSGKVKKAPDSFQVNGYTWLWRTITRPYRVMRIFRLFLFYILGFFNRFKKVNA